MRPKARREFKAFPTRRAAAACPSSGIIALSRRRMQRLPASEAIEQTAEALHWRQPNKLPVKRFAVALPPLHIVERCDAGAASRAVAGVSLRFRKTVSGEDGCAFAAIQVRSSEMLIKGIAHRIQRGIGLIGAAYKSSHSICSAGVGAMTTRRAAEIAGPRIPAAEMIWREM